MPVMLVSSFLILLILRIPGVDADFHFLTCRTLQSSTTSIPANPSIVVPASDMSSCSGILGSRMVVLENLTQEIGQQSVFSFNGFCDTQRLDVYTASSDLLGFYYSGGSGGFGLQGSCSPARIAGTPQNFSCVSDNLSLDCTDSWTCFSGICEAAREGSATTPFPKQPTTSGSPTNSPVSTVGSIDAPHSSADSTATSRTNSNSKTTTIVASILGVLCLGLGIAIVFLVCHSGIRRPRWGRGSDVEKAIAPATGTPVFVAPPQRRSSIYPVPFLAMEPSPSAASTLSPKAAGVSAPWPWAPLPALPEADSPASANSWQTQPPAYVPDAGTS
ncbi:hypothetical protein C8F01DRAFT_1115310 [Mycena amicta]|nr:hypothetical protein C8F01DRAFT_1115310 [Mycena amicta]